MPSTPAYSHYVVSPQDQGHALNTAPDDEGTIPHYYFTARHSLSSTYQPSESLPNDCLDFPTPKARLFNMMSRTSSPPLTHHRISRADSDFDSLYDITDDEAEVPLKCSASVKKEFARTKRNRYPSLVIPSPSTWPTIEKLQSAMSAVVPTPSQLLTPSLQGLSLIASHNQQVPTGSAAPSLDGSMTSEEMDRLSCPSTPETQKRISTSSLDHWGPVQLDLQAMETLQHLGQASPDHHEQQPSQAIEARVGEMQEVSRPFLGLTIPQSIVHDSVSNTPISALSVPSPSVFFSSLHSSARHTWSMPYKDDSTPNTSTAERFYHLPWETRRNTVAEQIVTSPERDSTLRGSTLADFEDGLPTSRPVMLGEDEALEIKEINPSKTIFQYNEQYHAELEKMASMNLERTGTWLTEQDELQAALRDMSSMSSPSLSSGTHSRGNSIHKSIKKTVTFADQPKSPAKEEIPKAIETYIQGFEYLCDRSRKNDSFIHRQTRAEAMHVLRRCMPQAHRDQLLGKFLLTDPVRPAPPRPVSEFYMNDPTVLKESIARAQTERQALDQMLPISWVLQALRRLNGGKLLSKPSIRRIQRTREPRILDVGGVPTNDWAWQVSYDYPYSAVTTVYTGPNPTSNVSGPGNHKHTTVPNLWTLPFPSAHFDVISARSLFELLKTDKPLGRSMDEYDLCLKECFRCLKPGGTLEFSLLDADIIRAARQAQALSVEFGFNLKTRGYDAAPTKSFLPRLRKAGFSDVQRMWMVLPMGKTAANWKDALPVGVEMPRQEERNISLDGHVEVAPAPVFGTTADAAMMTGMVGSWMYEKWMLRLQVEMGKEEERLLEGVVQVLEEGAREGSGWRYLMGYATK